VLRERTEPDASSHYFRNGQVWAYQQVAKELEALCPAPAARCELCEGKGYVEYESNGPAGTMSKACPDCNGAPAAEEEP